MKTYLKEIEKIRKILKVPDKRKKFWEENKKNFDRNIKELFEELKKNLKIDKKWRVYVASFSFISEKEIKPYDYDSFSSTNLIAKSEKQGFEIGIFLNKARLGFLSKPALIPMMMHELKHVEQAARNTLEYVESMFNDKVSEKLEKEAERQTEEEFRKEQIFESVLYCFDLGGWKFAEKMAEFLYKKICKIYGRGYEEAMKEQEYGIFLQAKKEKRIEKFIEYFCNKT